MITKYIKEHNGDNYLVKIPEAHEFECTCSRIIPKDASCWCEICQKSFCSHCGRADYKGTGWFVCQECLDHPERIIDALLTFI